MVLLHNCVWLTEQLAQASEQILGQVCRQLFILILAKVYTILQFHAAAAKDACARARATRVLTAALTLDLGSLEGLVNLWPCTVLCWACMIMHGLHMTTGGRSEPELPAEQSGLSCMMSIESLDSSGLVRLMPQFKDWTGEDLPEAWHDALRP